MSLSEKINNMFSQISGNYDIMNHVLSFGLDILWRKEAEKEALITTNKELRILDIATGTGDLAIGIAKLAKKKGITVKVYGVDFNREMLKLAKEKAVRNKVYIKFEMQDALHLKYPNNYFDVVISGFALRNFDNLKKLVHETHRVLKVGGKFVFLEVGKPDEPLAVSFLSTYFIYIKTLGSLVNKKAYAWFVESVKKFDKHELLHLVKTLPFKRIRVKILRSRIAFIMIGIKSY